jgi:hypothetical protein
MRSLAMGFQCYFGPFVWWLGRPLLGKGVVNHDLRLILLPIAVRSNTAIEQNKLPESSRVASGVRATPSKNHCIWAAPVFWIAMI